MHDTQALGTGRSMLSRNWSIRDIDPIQDRPARDIISRHGIYIGDMAHVVDATNPSHQPYPQLARSLYVQSMIEYFDDIPDSTLFLLEDFTEDYYDRLRSEISWRQASNMMFGKAIKQPRLSAWYGDEGKNYRFSGVDRNPLPWTELLSNIKKELEEALAHNFNSALLNWYRNGRDSIGFHSDDERELGSHPVIASLSYGAERALVLKHRRGVHADRTIWLPGQSLFVMAGVTQQHWTHGIEKVPDAEGRINITFRTIINQDQRAY